MIARIHDTDMRTYKRNKGGKRFRAPDPSPVAPVAQRTERRTSNPKVGGSNPPGRALSLEDVMDILTPSSEE